MLDLQFTQSPIGSEILSYQCPIAAQTWRSRVMLMSSSWELQVQQSEWQFINLQWKLLLARCSWGPATTFLLPEEEPRGRPNWSKGCRVSQGLTYGIWLIKLHNRDLTWGGTKWLCLMMVSFSFLDIAGWAGPRAFSVWFLFFSFPFWRALSLLRDFNAFSIVLLWLKVVLPSLGDFASLLSLL